jgi:Fe-S-cluster-containing dehydrogenase component
VVEMVADTKKEVERKLIICDIDKCNGCGLCEFYCAISKEKKINPKLSRIRTVRIEPFFAMSIACRKCETPVCRDACPRDAISIGEDGIPAVDKDKCNGCGWCIEACDFGAIRFNFGTKIVTACDYCKGEKEPWCIKYCPKKALTCETLEAAGTELSKRAFVRILGELEEFAKKK